MVRVLLFTLLLGGLSSEVVAAERPFLKRVASFFKKRIGDKAEFPPTITPPPVVREMAPLARELLSPNEGTATISPLPGTASDQRPDAGLPSLIGLLRDGGKLSVEMEPLKLDEESMRLLSRESQSPVAISVPLSQETSDSLNSAANRLPTLLTFIEATLGLLAASSLAPWVTRLASGLLPVLRALLAVPVPKSGSGAKSAADNQGVLFSTQDRDS